MAAFIPDCPRSDRIFSATSDGNSAIRRHETVAHLSTGPDIQGGIMRANILFASMALFATITQAESRADQPSLRLMTTISLDAVQGRIDHMAVDKPGKRLFVAALG